MNFAVLDAIMAWSVLHCAFTMRYVFNNDSFLLLHKEHSVYVSALIPICGAVRIRKLLRGGLLVYMYL